jgi:hypothetical protein
MILSCYGRAYTNIRFDIPGYFLKRFNLNEQFALIVSRQSYAIAF